MAVDSTCKKEASLALIDYESLANNDAGETEKLVQVCKTVGMFHLDIRGSKAKALLEDVPGFFKKGNKFFDLPEDSEEKLQAVRHGLERGYFKSPALKYYEIARDEFQLGKWVLPATLQSEKAAITRTLDTFNGIAQNILGKICAAVNLEIPELQDDPTVPSDTALKYLYKPPVHETGSVVIPSHSDFGILTLLWYDEVTTQLPIYDGKGHPTEEWEVVPVVEGTILVNVADDLAKRSGGCLNSTVHRVVVPPGPKRPKNGLVYFLRPYKN